MKSTFLSIVFIVILSFLALNSNAQIPHVGIYAHALYAAPLDNSSQALYNGGGLMPEDQAYTNLRSPALWLFISSYCRISFSSVAAEAELEAF